MFALMVLLKIHSKLATKAKELQLQFESGPRQMSILYLQQDWLVSHVKRIHGKYSFVHFMSSLKVVVHFIILKLMIGTTRTHGLLYFFVNHIQVTSEDTL